MDMGTIDQIIGRVRVESSELAVEFFFHLNNDNGFRHSAMFVFVVAHILVGKQQTRQLQEVLRGVILDEGVNNVNEMFMDHDGFWRSFSYKITNEAICVPCLSL